MCSVLMLLLNSKCQTSRGLKAISLAELITALLHVLEECVIIDVRLRVEEEGLSVYMEGK